MTSVFSNNLEQSITYAQFAIIIVCNVSLSLLKGLLRKIARMTDKVCRHSNVRTHDQLRPACKHFDFVLS